MWIPIKEFIKQYPEYIFMAQNNGYRMEKLEETGFSYWVYHNIKPMVI